MKTPTFWRSKNLLSTLLLPASCIYGIGARLDRTLTTPKRVALPVISVGNLTAGGAGKTPATLALIPMLRALGHTPHILTRGYGGANLRAHRVNENDDWRSVGDEALLLARAAPTWVGRDRLASAHAAKSAGATILVCDDALQHHTLHKDISLLVIDGPFGLGNRRLLPAGPLREPVANAISRADAAIMIGNDVQQLAATFGLPTYAAALQPTAESALSGKKLLAFAGIGRPEKFYETLRALGADIVATRDFADHHAYTETELNVLMNEAATLGATAITTAKDAVKIPPHLHPTIATLPVELALSEPTRLADFLANKLSSLHQA